MPVPVPAPKRNWTLIIGVAAAALALCLAGICAAAIGTMAIFKAKNGPSNDEVSAATPWPLETTSTPPQVEETPETVTTTEAAPPPPPARNGQCIAVSEYGEFQGIGNCNGTSGTYRVVSVDYYGNECADPESAYITEDGYRLCLEHHLVRNYCYKFPKGDGWIVGAPKCKAKGTVLVVDIVPGGANGNRCTQDYKWNRWYRFLNPTVVYCVMQY